ncbi:hypothetical protein O3G_MSEX002405 [Manduca sexta]|uniref:Reverse transcriptase domain-containing protein n=1 Tax=Manduca sexta TaxID=7130 RepID=A0A921YP11_MANSE|nr:hypothetical protein O3G_MSEX002405 [Manduca sexta]
MVIHPPIFIKRCAKVLIKPLNIVFNKSLVEGYFPDIWKLSKIVPVYKSGCKEDVCNYRPISILNCFAKVFESLVYKHLYYHFKQIISIKQHGFVNSKSTTTNLLTYTNVLCKVFCVKGQVDSIYIDFAKAFDRVDHNILCAKAEYLGIHGSLLYSTTLARVVSSEP